MLEFKDLKINDDEKCCYIDNQPIDLTKSEYNLLIFFLNNKNKVFSREELIKEGWKNPVNERTIDVAISRLRKKLGDYGKHLTSRVGFGYLFKE